MEFTDGLSSAQSFLLLLALDAANDSLMNLALNVEKYMCATKSPDTDIDINAL